LKTHFLLNSFYQCLSTIKTALERNCFLYNRVSVTNVNQLMGKCKIEQIKFYFGPWCSYYSCNWNLILGI